MLTALPAPSCIIDRNRILLENKTGIAFRDGFPASPGHPLIIPRRHIASLDYPRPVESYRAEVAQGYPPGLVVGNSPGPSMARRRVVHNCEAPGG